MKSIIQKTVLIKNEKWKLKLKHYVMFSIQDLSISMFPTLSLCLCRCNNCNSKSLKKLISESDFTLMGNLILI